MKKLKAILAVLLILAFVLPLFAACGEKDQQTDKPAQTDKPKSTAGEENDGTEGKTETDDDEEWPIEVVDMGEKTFTILTAGWGGDGNLTKDIGAEEITDDPIEDAAYDRRIKLEEMYNCKIVQVNFGENDTAVNNYIDSVMAGTGDYDFAVTNCTNFEVLLTSSCLLDLEDMPYVDMDKPYWQKRFYESMAILGRHYAAIGDITKRRMEAVQLLCFNKDIIQEYNLESPYDLVENQEWTYDKMHEMAKKVAKDLNTDGKMERMDDMWGINYTGDTIMGIINSVGVNLAELDEEGIPQLTVTNQTNLDKLMRIFENMRDNTYCIDTLFMSGGGTSGIPDAQIFGESRCLFLACAAHNATQLREIDVNFGVIPYPKWDLAQETYLPHTGGNYHPVLSVPKTNDDLENTGLILEAMSYEGMRTIIPAFYEGLLKIKAAGRDDESADMIDYIFGNLSYDVGNMYGFGGIVGVMGYTMSTDMRANIVSQVEKNSGKWQRAINAVVEGVEKND